MDRGTCWATVHSVAKRWIQLKQLHNLIYTRNDNVKYEIFHHYTTYKVSLRQILGETVTALKV